MESALTAFWIESLFPHAPMGFGVTGRNLEDALDIIRAFGYGRFLPDDQNELRIREGITVAQLDHAHVVANIGSIVVRGIWYPFVAVGVPGWAKERL